VGHPDHPQPLVVTGSDEDKKDLPSLHSRTTARQGDAKLMSTSCGTDARSDAWLLGCCFQQPEGGRGPGLPRQQG